jgi:hypothetical protein
MLRAPARYLRRPAGPVRRRSGRARRLRDMASTPTHNDRSLEVRFAAVILSELITIIDELVTKGDRLKSGYDESDWLQSASKEDRQLSTGGL